MGHRPRIAGYCRVLPRSGTVGKKRESKVQSPKSKAMRGCRLVGKNCRSYRLGPHKSAWNRLKFFLCVKWEEIKGRFGCGFYLQEYNPWGWAAWGRLRPLR